MKKFTLLLAATLLSVGSAFAQAATLPFADGIYTIEGGTASAHRGFLAAGEGITAYPVLSEIGWSDHAAKGITAIENGKMWYITPNYAGTHYFIYNVALGKFISGEGNQVNFSDIPYGWEIVNNPQGGVTYTSIKNVSFACGTKPDANGIRDINFHWEAGDGGSTHIMTLIADGLTTFATAVANAEAAIRTVDPTQIFELSDITNDFLYTINSQDRGYLYYNESGSTDKLYSSSHTTITDDPAPVDNTAAHFAILRTNLTADGQYYIYNTAAQKFLSYAGSGTAVDLVDDATYKWSISEENGFFLIKVPGTQQTRINVTNWSAVNGCRVSDATSDGGNRMELTSIPVNNVDLNTAKEKIILNDARALLQDISGFSSEHFGEGLGYLYGSDHETISALAEALQTTFESSDVDVITSAAEELAAEVAKVQVRYPEGGKYYRFKGYKNNKYITPTSASGKMAQNATPDDASVFLFQAVEGSNDTFKPINVKYNAGITGTHSLSSNGEETYTLVPSEGKIAGVFTVKSNATGGAGIYLHDNNATADRYAAYDSTNHATNWYLEEVNRDGTTGIEEIVVETEKVQGIYDLQGRRLSAPVKGINIINGKKVLVK